MFWFSKRKKSLFFLSVSSCVVSGTGFGLSFIPLAKILTKKSKENVITARTQKRSIWYPRLVLGSSDNGRELHIEGNRLVKNKTKGVTISFSEVKMKWGHRQLRSQDALISSCERGAYYVARHVWDVWYQLDNGKKFSFSQDICTGLKENSKTIQLNFTKKNRGGQISKLKLLVGTCSFKWNNSDNHNTEKWKLNMDCKGDNSSGGAENQEEVTLLLSEKDYKHEYYLSTGTIN